MKGFKPMLASAAKDITFPVYASAKIDGIRAVMHGRELVSRTLKRIPNEFVQGYFADVNLDGMDGELVVGPPNHKNTMQATTSGVMSKAGEPDFTFYAFDVVMGDRNYAERYAILKDAMRSPHLQKMVRVEILEQVLINNAKELDAFEAKCLEDGYEGIMIRKPDGHYKFGRSTPKEGLLLKVKRFSDSEAVIVGFEELLHNANPATVNELGQTERSHHAENKVPTGTLGSLVVQDAVTGVEFGIGTGFSAAQRQWLWDNRADLCGQTVKYKHFEVGVKEAPRFPVYLGFRDPIDMGEL